MSENTQEAPPVVAEDEHPDSGGQVVDEVADLSGDPVDENEDVDLDEILEEG